MRRMHVTLRSSRLLIQNEKILITVGRKRDLMIRQSMLSDCLAPATQLANHVLLLLFVSVNIGNISCVCYATDKSVRPNIVLIMADDLGWTDLGCLVRATIKRPNSIGFVRSRSSSLQPIRVVPIVLRPAHA
jgi:hypothetical protein